jgi:putative copper resistance protein D
MTLALLLATGSVYAVGYRRLARGGVRFGAGRAWCFAAGLLCLVVALASPLEPAAETSFTAHVAQHLLLGFVAPPLLALGAPITLALRAGPIRLRRPLARALRSRTVAFLTNPIVGWALFVGTPFVYHLTSLFEGALRSDPAHVLEHAALFGTAVVYWWPIVGVDPSPHPVPYPARLLSLFLAMPAMSFLALALYMARDPLYPTYLVTRGGTAAALMDQHAGAVTMWLVGNLWMVLAMLVVLARWKRHDDETQRRFEDRGGSPEPVPLISGRRDERR